MMPTSPAGEPVTIHLPPADRAELDALARASARDTSALAAEAVTAYLDAWRWQAEIIRHRLAGGVDDLATDDEVDAAYAAFR